MHILPPPSPCGKKVKIIATLGPASFDEKIVAKLIKSGVDVFRINCSHSSLEVQKTLVNRIRRVSAKLGTYTGIMFDLQGPRIRLGEIDNKQKFLKTKETVYVSNKKINKDIIQIIYPDLLQDAKKKERILINDGLVELKIREILKDRIKCTVTRSGVISSRKGVNFPDTKLNIPVITSKDKKDIKSGIELNCDYFALSFVKNQDDIINLRKLIDSYSKSDNKPGIIAKIERPEAYKNIDKILDKSDGIMVARGDLGIEISLENVPLVQKELITKARERGKTVITATQILESMINNSSPTRAEVSDAYNSVADGTDCVMLSGETAAGRYPVQSVKWLLKIINKAEKESHKKINFNFYNLQNSITENASDIADEINAKYLICFTMTGSTAQIASAVHPSVSILGMTVNETVCRRMSLYYGVKPVCISEVDTIDDMLKECRKYLISNKLVSKGDKAVLTAGIPFHKSGTTNLIKVIEI